MTAGMQGHVIRLPDVEGLLSDMAKRKPALQLLLGKQGLSCVS